MGKAGFRKINNALYEALIGMDFSRACYKVVLTVIHFTLGYNQRTEADISQTTFKKLTGLSLPAVKKALRQLQLKNVIAVVTKGNITHKPTVYRFNTNFETWRTGKVQLPSTREVELPSKDVKTYPVNNQNLPSTGKVAMPEPRSIKKEIKPLKKSITPPEMSFVDESISNTPPLKVTPIATLPNNLPRVVTRATSLEGIAIGSSRNGGNNTLSEFCDVCGKPPTKMNRMYHVHNPDHTWKPVCADCCGGQNLDGDDLCSKCGYEGTDDNPIEYTQGGRPLCDRCQSKPF
jgi:phage replication O-like protein O